MRLVLDTNTVISGLLWHGAPRHLIALAIDEQVSLYSSPTLLAELANTLKYPKIIKRIDAHNLTAEGLIAQYEALVTLVSPDTVHRTVPNDSDDDHVIAAALAADANVIVSGDRDLLILHPWRGLPIINAAEALRLVLDAQ